ncbi:hypothetical protein V8F33_002509 [Rhypophila sp. PSN 637]
MRSSAAKKNNVVSHRLRASERITRNISHNPRSLVNTRVVHQGSGRGCYCATRTFPPQSDPCNHVCVVMNFVGASSSLSRAPCPLAHIPWSANHIGDQPPGGSKWLTPAAADPPLLTQHYALRQSDHELLVPHGCRSTRDGPFFMQMRWGYYNTSVVRTCCSFILGCTDILSSERTCGNVAEDWSCRCMSASRLLASRCSFNPP